MAGSWLQELADLFTALGRIFGDPLVQEKATAFVDALGEASDRELPAVLDRKELGQ